MKSKREILESIRGLYSEYMSVWSFVNFGVNITIKLIPSETTVKKEHYIIANAANKFWNLISK